MRVQWDEYVAWYSLRKKYPLSTTPHDSTFYFFVGASDYVFFCGRLPVCSSVVVDMMTGGDVGPALSFEEKRHNHTVDDCPTAPWVQDVSPGITTLGVGDQCTVCNRSVRPPIGDRCDGHYRRFRPYYWCIQTTPSYIGTLCILYIYFGGVLYASAYIPLFGSGGSCESFFSCPGAMLLCYTPLWADPGPAPWHHVTFGGIVRCPTSGYHQ